MKKRKKWDFDRVLLKKQGGVLCVSSVTLFKKRKKMCVCGISFVCLSLFCVWIYECGVCGWWCVVCGGDRFLKYAPDGKNDAREKTTYARTYYFCHVFRHGVFITNKKLSLGINVCLYFIFCPHDSI